MHSVACSDAVQTCFFTKDPLSCLPGLPSVLLTAVPAPSSLSPPPMTRKNFSFCFLLLPRPVTAPPHSPLCCLVLGRLERGGVPATLALPASPHGRRRLAFFRNAGANRIGIRPVGGKREGGFSVGQESRMSGRARGVQGGGTKPGERNVARPPGDFFLNFFLFFPFSRFHDFLISSHFFFHFLIFF